MSNSDNKVKQAEKMMSHDEKVIYSGMLINKHYRIVKRLSVSGMGRAYLAVDTSNDNRPCVIKEIGEDNREARILSRLSYEGIPRITDTVVFNKKNIIVMEYIEGKSLGEILRDEGAQPLTKVVEWGIQLCRMVQYLHEQNPPVIHCDIKPGNVILQADGKIALIDFGSARECVNNPQVVEAPIMISKGYTPKELLKVGGIVDATADIYSLGATLYVLLTNLKAEDMLDFFKPLGECALDYKNTFIEMILGKCLQQDRSERYLNCRSLEKALQSRFHFDRAGLRVRTCHLKSEIKQRILGAGKVLFRHNDEEKHHKISSVDKAADIDMREVDYYADAVIANTPQVLR